MPETSTYSSLRRRGVGDKTLEILLLVLLAASVAVIFVPELMKERFLDSPIDTVTDFHRGMVALAISTHNDRSGRYRAQRYEPEPYFRRNQYDSSYNDGEDQGEFIPYPRTRGHVESETRKHRILITMWLVVLATSFLMLVPSLKWIIPLHIVLLVLLAAYSMAAIVLPYYRKRS
jgi:hypothetical protein